MPHTSSTDGDGVMMTRGGGRGGKGGGGGLNSAGMAKYRGERGSGFVTAREWRRPDLLPLR